MTPEQRTAARQRLQKRIGMPYEYALRLSEDAERRLAESMIEVLLYGSSFVTYHLPPAGAPPDLVIKDLPTFRKFAERHR